MQTRSCDENSVRPSVRQTRELWQNGRKICLDFHIIRKNILVLWEEEWLVGGDPFYLKFWVNRPALERIADFEPIIARSASAVWPSEKSSVNTNMKSPTRFPTSLTWSSYVAPKSPKGWLKNCKTAVFPLQSHFAWRKSVAKFLCVKIVNGKVVGHYLA